MRYWILLACLALLSLAASIASQAPNTGTPVSAASQYWISPTGSDSANCSLGTPCATLAKATGLALPGDSVYMESGSYGPQTISAIGSALAPIQISAQGPVTLTRALSPPASVQAAPLLTITNSANIVVQGLTILGMLGRSDQITTTTVSPAELAISNTTTSGVGIEISGTVVMSSTGAAVFSTNQQVMLFDDVFVADGSGSAPVATLAAQNSVVSTSVFSSTNGTGVALAGSSVLTPTITGTQILSNTFYNLPNTAVTSAGDNVLIYNNDFYHNNAAGSAYFSGNNVRFAFNNVQADATSVTSVIVQSGTNDLIVNNFINGTNIAPLQIGATGVASHTVVENNIMPSGEYNRAYVTTTLAYNTYGDYNAYGYYPANLPTPGNYSTAPPCSVVGNTWTYGVCSPDQNGNTLTGAHDILDTGAAGPRGVLLWPGIPGLVTTYGYNAGSINYLITPSVFSNAGTPVGFPFTGSAPDLGAACYSTCVYTTTYYMSPTGNDNYPCTLALPCQTMPVASAKMHPGDTLFVLPGTYYGTFRIGAAGAPNASVNLIGTPGTVTLTYPISSSLAEQGLSLFAYATSHLNISGIVFLGMLGRPDYLSHGYHSDLGQGSYNGTDLVFISQQPAFVTADHISVLNSESTGYGCLAWCSVTNSTFSNNGPPYGDSEDHALYVDCDHIYIANNTFNGSSGFDIQLHQAGCPTGGNTITGNTATGGVAGGIEVDATPVTITNNIVYSNIGQGIQVMSNATVTNNILWNNNTSNSVTQANNNPGGIRLTANPATGDIVANNTLYGDYGFEISAVAGIGSGTIIANNITANPAKTFSSYVFGVTPGAVVAGNIGFNSASTGYLGAGVFTLDPLFANSITQSGATNNFSLRPDSPAIGLGVPVAGLLYGGNAPDAGAVCYQCGLAQVPVTHSAGAESFYVSTTALPAQTACTQAAPCATVENAQNFMRPGDVIVLESGVYTQPMALDMSNITLQSQGLVTVTALGTGSTSESATQVTSNDATPRLRFMGALTDTIQQIAFDGGSISTGVVTTTGSNIVDMGSYTANPGIGGFSFISDTVQNSLGTGACLYFQGFAVAVEQSTLNNCYIGITASPYNTQIISSTINNIAWEPVNLATTPNVASGPGAVVLGSTLYNGGTSGGANPPDMISASGSPRFVGNVFAYQDSDIKLYATTNAYIANNIFSTINTANQTMGYIDDGNGTNTQVYNNTFEGGNPIPYTAGYGFPGGIYTNSYSPIIKNNILFGAGYAIAFGNTGGIHNGVADYNDLYGIYGGVTLSSTPDANGNTLFLPHTISGNPLLNGNGSLQATSPAIQAGTNVGLPYQSPAPDMGAIPYRTAFDTNLGALAGFFGRNRNTNQTVLLILLTLAGTSAIGFYGLGNRFRRM